MNSHDGDPNINNNKRREPILVRPSYMESTFHNLLNHVFERFLLSYFALQVSYFFGKILPGEMDCAASCFCLVQYASRAPHSTRHQVQRVQFTEGRMTSIAAALLPHLKLGLVNKDCLMCVQ